jgi:GNAT superfamily N-acetyltransferase
MAGKDGAVERITPGSEREAFVPLLLLADEAEAQVRSYYQRGDLYAMWDDEAPGRAPLGVVLTLPTDEEGTVELKAVAVAEERHGQGIGQRLLAGVLGDLRERGVRRAIVGTSNAGIGQLAFYQKAGFRFWRIERDFFTLERGYDPAARENGLAHRDMVWLERGLRTER